MSRSVLAINSGSSSIKFALHGVPAGGAPGLASRGLLDLGDEARLTIKAAGGKLLVDLGLPADVSLEAGFGKLLDWIDEQSGPGNLIGVGHRVVHGGREYIQPLLLTSPVIEALEALTPLAPLHQPRSLMPVRAIERIRPGLPQVGCFDTAFHRTIAATVSRIALPRRYEVEGVRRYGFHGLSYEYMAERLGTISPELPAKRTIVAHLGNGASLCAMRAGKSVDTTMGFSALDGLVMGTRCGGIDPRPASPASGGGADGDRAPDPALPAVGAARRVGYFRRRPDPPGQWRGSRPGGARSVRLSGRAGSGGAGRHSGGPGMPGLHGRHRGERAADPRFDLRAACLAGGADRR